MAVKNLLKTGFFLSTIGLYFVSSIIAGIIIGYFLDKWFRTRPVFFLIFLVLGIVEGFRNLIVSTKKYMDADDDKKDKQDPGH